MVSVCWYMFKNGVCMCLSVNLEELRLGEAREETFCK